MLKQEPPILPDGKQCVFLADASSDEGHRIRLASVEHNESKILLSGTRSSPTVDPRGALMVVAQRSQLVSYPFDFKRGTLGRESHLVADRVGAVGDRHETPTTIAAHAILAYQTGADLVRIALDDGLTAAVATAVRKPGDHAERTSRRVRCRPAGGGPSGLDPRPPARRPYARLRARRKRGQSGLVTER